MTGEMKTPAERLCSFLGDAWMDNTAAEALSFWTRRVEQVPDYAEDVLATLDAVIADPPENLVDVMQECGWIYLSEETYETVTPLGHEAYLDWLKRMRDDFRKVYEERTGARSA